jgi:hypothetical protein
MRYKALASDYDRTLATEGRVSNAALAAIDRWRAAGGKMLLVTGRHLEDLFTVFPAIDHCDLAVLENGSLLYNPTSGETSILGSPPPDALVQMLREQGVEPLAVGRGNLSTRQPHEQTVRAALHRLQLDWHVILNKTDVIIMPPGMNKAAGLRIALEQLGISPEQTVGVGDAENDQDMLDLCGYGAAVANALPALKTQADMVTQAENGAGVTEVIDYILASYADESA